MLEYSGCLEAFFESGGVLLGISHRFPSQAHRKTDRVLRQLEAGGAVARAALRKLLLSRMTLEERVAKVREAIWRIFFR